MLLRLIFYLRHSWNDLVVNGRRTLFALLCIAAGVSAVVSLQTLAAMIGATLTSNLQQNNRGDMQVLARNATNPENEARLRAAVAEGLLSGSEINFGGQQGTSYALTEQGVLALRQWFEQTYPGQARLTYRQSISNPLAVFTGSGPGTIITHPRTQEQIIGIVPVMIEVALYPFYGRLTDSQGLSLAEALREPTDLALGQNAAERLGAQVGDSVTLQGLDVPFTVRLIVRTEDEVRNPFQDALAALNGFYLLDVRSRELFPDLPFQADVVYVELDPTLNVAQVEEALLERFDFLRATTTEDLRRTYQLLTDNVNQLVTVMGLISLLLGSIGIVNTMQVVVRRRTQEIAVLKTLGLQAQQITSLFLVEAALMGLIGSVLGVGLGWVMVFFIRGVAENLLGALLPFEVAPSAVVGGLVVGTLVTTVFGFLPTLSAGLVRPAAVLHPNESPLPTMGWGRTALALLAIIVALILVANTILNSLLQSALVIVGAFGAAFLLYGLLIVVIWFLARAFPSFGVVDLKIALREMLAARARGASTLLALVVGVFSLSLITLLADSVSSVISQNFLSGDNIFIQVGGGETGLARVEQALAALPGPISYTVNRSYNYDLVGVRKADGTLQNAETLRQILRETSFFGSNDGSQAGQDGQTQQANASAEQNFGPPRDIGAARLRGLSSSIGSINATNLDALPELTIAEGRNLSPQDAGQAVIVVTRNGTTNDVGLSVGDTLLLEYGQGGFLGIGARRIQQEFLVVGLAEQTTQFSLAFSTSYAPADSFPADRAPSQIRISAQIPDSQIALLRRALAQDRTTFLLETAVINQFILTILGQFTAFPLLVAALGLVVGGVVIANSVALATLERRREIAVMKSIGLQRERVLLILLLENGLLGLVGGLIGVGLGLVGLLILLSRAPLGTPISVGAAFLLMLLCVLIALAAALSIAWDASSEKPLNVLRYE
ncbi:MAG: ABC transporter permease [Anaerolineae bacterium]|nr:ABC transporter permease [Anaerolineae bacterium]MDW8170888.1 FtsX-like permease family protein [Anaerolineae bacterium]